MSSTECDKFDRWAVVVAAVGVAASLFLGLVALPLPIVALVLLAVSTVASQRPTGAIAAVAVTLPWFYQPIRVGALHVAASELLLLVATMSVAIHLTFTFVARRTPLDVIAARVRRVAVSRLVVILSLLTGVGLILSVFPYDQSHRAESLREWRWTLLEPLLFLSLLLFAANRRNDQTLVAGALLAGGAIAAAQAFADLLTGGGVHVAGVTRITGPYPHPNALALMEARIAAFGIAWWVWSSRSPRSVLGASTVVALAATASLSRGAILALGVAVVLALPRLNRTAQLISLAGAGAGVAALIIFARDRMLDVFNGGSGSLRLDIWRSATEMIAARPFVGYGPDQFLYAYLPRYVEPSAWNERFTAHAHNIVFDFWIRLGIIGFAFTVMVGVICVRLALRAARGESDGALRAAAIIALTAALIHGLIDNAYFAHDLAMSGWLLGWLALGPRAADSPEGVDNGARPGYRRRWVHRFSSLR